MEMESFTSKSYNNAKENKCTMSRIDYSQYD